MLGQHSETTSPAKQKFIHFKIVVLDWRQFCIPGDTWEGLEKCFGCHSWSRVFLASDGRGLGMLPNTLQGTGCPTGENRQHQSDLNDHV